MKIISLSFFFLSTLTFICAQVIPDRYIVVFKPDTSPESLYDHILFFRELELLSSFDKEQLNWFRWTNSDNTKTWGYVANMNEIMLGDITFDTNIDYVEPDQIVTINTVQNDAPWHLTRISHHEKTVTTDFLYNENDGKNVTVYIIDTGVHITHSEFEGRAHFGISIPDDKEIDGNGHGTHVAGIVASKTYGVAKKAEIVAVKVLRSDGSGTMGDVIRGIEWVVDDSRTNNRKSVANMSLGGGRSRALNSAVEAAVAAGVHFVVAAGNEDADACFTSPASAETVITVGATTLADDRAWFSNWGNCVNVFAPGHLINSTWNDDSYNIISGTSMASPVVAGVVAAYISREEHADKTTSQIFDLVAELATKDALKDIPTNTSNLLVYSDPVEELDNLLKIQT